MNPKRKQFRYLEWITILYVTFQLISDVTAGKIINFFGFSVSVTVLYFPVTYIFGDVLTEVYGYSHGRHVLWKVLVCSIAAGLIYQLAVFLPPAVGFDPITNDAYARVLGSVPRILVGGWIAVFSGEIANDYTLAKMKILTKGKFLWTRTIGSTIVGEFFNTSIFYFIGLYGIIPNNLLFESILTGWILKTLVEVIATPLTYIVVDFLKRAEGEDFYDIGTDFNPFIISPYTSKNVKSDQNIKTNHF